MSTSSATQQSFANDRAEPTTPSRSRRDSNIVTVSMAIASEIKGFAMSLKDAARWIGLNVHTIKNKLIGSRDFSVEEVELMLHTGEGYRILRAIMRRCPNPPHWWLVVEPTLELMEIEDARSLLARRFKKAVKRIDDADAILEDQIGRAQAAAIRGSGPAGVHRDALQSLARPTRRVVAKARD